MVICPTSSGHSRNGPLPDPTAAYVGEREYAELRAPQTAVESSAAARVSSRLEAGFPIQCPNAHPHLPVILEAILPTTSRHLLAAVSSQSVLCPSTMIIIPTRLTETPIQSVGVGRTLSTSISQTIATPMYTPP